MENNLKLEKMRYNNNSISYTLGLIAILFSIIATFVLLNSSAPRFSVFVKIILNILVLLFGFLATEKVKNYQLKYSYTLYGIGIICYARILWYPLQLIINYHLFLTNTTYDSVKKTRIYNEDVTDELVAKISKILAPVVKGESSPILPQSAYTRAGIAIACLLIAGSCFIAAAYIGQKKSIALSNYLNSIKKQ